MDVPVHPMPQMKASRAASLSSVSVSALSRKYSAPCVRTSLAPLSPTSRGTYCTCWRLFTSAPQTASIMTPTRLMVTATLPAS
jgi:hypothetical protein